MPCMAPDSFRISRAHSGTVPSPKISGTCPVRCPFLFRAIVKRHAMAGSRLGRYVETGQPPAFSGDGWGSGLSGSVVAGALSGTVPPPKRSGTCPSRYPTFTGSVSPQPAPAA
ncbi:MAG: hypothetical protein WC593_07235 [Methanoregula sp.]